MTILVEVHSSDRDGLVGKTEDGEHVLLSAPHPQSISRPNCERDKLLRTLKDTANKDPTNYYQISEGEKDINKGTTSFAYNVYRKRTGRPQIEDVWHAQS